MLHIGPLITNMLTESRFFDVILFLLGENVSLEEIRISDILMTKHVCSFKGSKKLVKSHIILKPIKDDIIHQLT